MSDALAPDGAEDIVAVFPTPVMIVRGALDRALVDALIGHFEASDRGPNVRGAALAHTPMENPRANAVYTEATRRILPRVRRFGEALMGESLSWAIKEIWINRMETGGAQKMHNHANSFVSGVVYLTETDPSAATTFYRQVGASGFQMQNENDRCRIGPFNTPIYRTPPVAPGDMVLFPSHLLHEVPPNQGPPRMTAAFNALPERIDSWGYVLKFR